ncbi:hypothetical protein IWW57_002089 [Coemansia sp. S610]|nr:hypothetical protein IWW57_002089 [Coemansia sp. S610]
MTQPILSPLQLLPLHVVKLIVDHVVGSSRLVYDGVHANSRQYRELLKPLLLVSHNFREIALRYYWKTFEVNLTDKTLDELRRYRPPFGAFDEVCYRADYLSYPTKHLAKEVTVYLDERAVFLGEALDKLSGVPSNNCVFPRAHLVIFVFAEDYMDEENDADTAIDLARASSNTRAFVQRIKQMAPSVSKIKMKLPDRDGISSVPNQPFDDLVSQLYELASHVGYSYESIGADPLRLRLGTACHLTHISYESTASRGNVDEFVRLAKMNTSTLQSLVIRSEGDMDVLSLVQDADGRHVTYPCLVALSLIAYDVDDDEPHRPTFQGAAPFPTLRRLTVFLNSPFNDDTFFRGNAATLEQLFYILDGESVSMLRKYKVFAPDSHPKLQAVRLCLLEDFRLESFASPAEAMRFVHNIGSGAALRDYTIHPPVDILLSLDDYVCIQVLSLRNMRLEFEKVLALIESLPLLSDLHTDAPILRQIPDGVTMDTLPEYVISKYAPMGKWLRCWHIHICDGQFYNDLAACVTCVTCALLLALACPNFAYAALSSVNRRPFMELMETSITSDRFKPYASRLRCLLFLGWNGKND